MTGLSDLFQRPINYLRISVTDRCNLRCVYCMPPGGVRLMRHRDILSYEEIRTLVAAASRLGISKLRLTGGEPLVRADLPRLVAMLAEIETIDDIALTTNGMLLEKYAAELKRAGLRRVNVSLDTLRPERFRRITRRGNLEDVLKGIDAAKTAGLNPVKINTVVMAGINDDELLGFAGKTIDEGWHVRFIELMPLSGNELTASQFMPVSEIRKRLEALGTLEPAFVSAGNGPAKYFRFPGAAGTVGFITPVSEHFCFKCNRLRLTADGKLRPCLLSEQETDLKQLLRHGSSAAELEEAITGAIASKPKEHNLAGGELARNRPYSQVGG